MNHSFLLRRLRALAALSLLVSFLSHTCAPSARAQREHLTPEEVELVRDAQALDLRMGVFARAVERRLLVMSDPQADVKLTAKEAEQWGAAPKGTRAQLLSDVAHILDEAITNIDDAVIHSEKSPLIPKALRRLAEAGARFVPQMTAMRERVEDARERDLLEQAIESAQQIVEAADKLPAEPEEPKKKSKKQ